MSVRLTRAGHALPIDIQAAKPVSEIGFFSMLAHDTGIVYPKQALAIRILVHIYPSVNSTRIGPSRTQNGISMIWHQPLSAAFSRPGP